MKKMSAIRFMSVDEENDYDEFYIKSERKKL